MSRRELRLLLKTALARGYIRIKGNFRDPTIILWDITFPMLMLVTILYTYHALGAPPIYNGFVVLGSAMMAFWINILWGMGNTLYWEKELGLLEAYMVSPSPLEGLLLGLTWGGMTVTMSRSIIFVIVGILFFGVEFNLSAISETALIFLLTLIALYFMGIAISGLYLMYSRTAWRTAELLTEPVYFLSGAYYPIQVFPASVQMIASLIPLTIGLDGVRRTLVMGEGFPNVATHIILLLSMIPILLIVSEKVLNYLVTKSKKEGRLLLRWM
ncbi:MAG TPA: ABC transporter permease [Candidatus Bathyarchaeota archaeon]|nr:ABC transporter permease [Candidatus Bathyarchaeota archaeon]